MDKDPIVLAPAYSDRGLRGRLRSQHEFADLGCPGRARVEPGVVLVSGWRLEPGSLPPQPSEASTYGGGARKP